LVVVLIKNENQSYKTNMINLNQKHKSSSLFFLHETRCIPGKEKYFDFILYIFYHSYICIQSILFSSSCFFRSLLSLLYFWCFDFPTKKKMRGNCSDRK
jgi:hypothetical protein